jgi:hypothetical protein
MINMSNVYDPKKAVFWLAISIPTVFYFSKFIGSFMWDASVYMCGAEAYKADISPYSAHGMECLVSGLPFVYPPLFAWALSLLPTVLLPIILYGLHLAFSFLLIFLVFWIAEPASRGRASVLFLTFIGGINLLALLTGNLSVAFYSMLALALYLGSVRTCYVICLLGTLIKAQYGVFFLVPFLIDRNVLRAGIFGMLLATIFALDAWAHPRLFAEWLSAVSRLADGPDVGWSFLHGLAALGSFSPTEKVIAYVPYAVGLIGLFLWATQDVPRGRQYGLLATLLGISLLPRLKEYDLLLVVPIYLHLSMSMPDRLRLRSDAFCLLAFALLPIAALIAAQLPRILLRLLGTHSDLDDMIRILIDAFNGVISWVAVLALFVLLCVHTRRTTTQVMEADARAFSD